MHHGRPAEAGLSFWRPVEAAFITAQILTVDGGRTDFLNTAHRVELQDIGAPPAVVSSWSCGS